MNGCTFSKNYIQSVVDIIGYAENVPVRILHFDKLNNTSPSDLLNLDASQTDGTEDELNSICDWIESVINNVHTDATQIDINAFNQLGDSDYKYFNYLKKIEDEIWLNKLSNPIHLHSLFRLSYEWTWFILAWCYCRRKKLLELANRNAERLKVAPDTLELMSPFGLKSLVLLPINLNCIIDSEETYIAFVGPVFDSPDEFHPENFYQNIGLPVLESYERFYKKFAKQSHTQLFSRDDMKRVLLTRTPISPKGLFNRATDVVNQLELANKVYNAFREHSEILDVTQQLAQIIVASYRLTTKKYDFTKKILRKTITISAPIYVQGDHAFSVKLEFTGEDFHLVKCEKAEKCLPANKRDLITVLDIDEPSVEKSISLKVEEWIERIFARRRNLQTLKIRTLTDWLNYHYSDFGSLPLNGEQSKAKHYYRFLCTAILESVSADACNFFEYKPSADSLILRGHAINSHGEDIVRQSSVLENVQKSDSCYAKCIEERESVFSPSIDHTNECFIKVYEKDIYPKSTMLMPVLIQGRCLGLIEVSCFQKNALQWSSQTVLSHFSSNLAQFLFGQIILRNLKEISKHIISTSASIDQFADDRHTFDSLCEDLSKIFLSRCTSIWLSEPSKPDEFLLRGHAGTDIYKEEGDKLIFIDNDDDEQSLCGKLLRNFKAKKLKKIVAKLPAKENTRKESFFDDEEETWTMGETYFSSRPHRLAMQNNNMRELVLLLICDDKYDNRPIGFVSLLDDHYTPNSDWMGVMDQITDHLLIALEHYRSQWQKSNKMRGIVRHEIKRNILQIQEIREETKHRIDSLADLRFSNFPYELSEGQWQDFSDIQKHEFLSQIQRFLRNVNKTRALVTDISRKSNNFDIHINSLRTLSCIAERGEHYDLISVLEASGDVNWSEPPKYFESRWALEGFTYLHQSLYETYHSRKKSLTTLGLFMDVKPEGSIEDYWMVSISPELLLRFWQNIFDNLVKYANNQRSIDISFEYVKSKKSHLLQIKNLGSVLPSGITPASLWEFNVRARNQTEQEGEGIGLYILAEIFKHLGVKYELDYREHSSGGTATYAFKFYFPEHMVRKSKSNSYFLSYSRERI